MNNLADQFLFLCKRNFYEKITPSSINTKEEVGNKYLRVIALQYFDNGLYNEFCEFFKEGSYLVDLWAAHLFLDHGNNDIDISTKALEIIKRYSENPLTPNVAVEEKNWLCVNAFN